VSVDVSKVPDKCLAGVSELPHWMCLANISPPEWGQAPLSGGAFFCSGRQVTADWLAGQGVTRTAVEVGENCGVTALALARFLGCAPIYLFGMDQALDDNDLQRRHHQVVSEDLYVESGFNAEVRHPRVPGNYEQTVSTHIESDWRALNAALAEWPEGLVFNVIDRGARLTNTTLVAPDQWVLGGGGGEKTKRVGALTLPSSEFQLEAVLARVREVARARFSQVDALVAKLAQGGPIAAQEGFRPLMADREFAQLMGAFSLKLMPHLFPPVEGSVAFWQELVAECRELTLLAAELAG